MSLFVGQTLDGQPTPVRTCSCTAALLHCLQATVAMHVHATRPCCITRTQTPPPLPDNPRVTLEAAGGQVVAVLRFEGFITPETAATARDTLLRCLQRGM